ESARFNRCPQQRRHLCAACCGQWHAARLREGVAGKSCARDHRTAIPRTLGLCTPLARASILPKYKPTPGRETMNDHLISRRALLAGTAAAGALSLTGLPARAEPQW